MKFKKHIQKKRLLNQLYIKLGLINGGNDNNILKNDVKKIIKKINSLKV